MSSIMREDWAEVELGEICFTTSGGTPSRNKIEFYQGAIPWVKSGELDKGVIYDTEEHISEEAVKNSSAKIFPEGTLLIALYGATIGKLAFLGVEAATNQAICGIFKSSAIDPKYLFNFLLNRRQKLISQGTGGAQPNISQTILKNLALPLAPLPIQCAIVRKIEALFSDLDNGIANFKKAQEQLKVYRQAVLKKAFEGELTKEWREKQNNLPTAEELLIQIKEERQNHYNQQIEDWKKAVKEWEKNGKKGKKPSKPTESKELSPLKDDELKDLPELHDNGVYVRMGNLSDVVRGGSPRPAGDERYYNGNIPFLKVADLTRSTTKYVNTYTYTIKEAGLHKTRLLESGTLVISNSGATLGVPRILSIKATANDGIAAFLDLNESRIEYLYHYWDSKTLALRAIDQGAGQPNLNTDLLKNYPVPVFSLQEQTQIVQEIESRLSVCDKMEQSLNESIEKAEALRQSILKKAFEGKLLSEAEIAQCKAAADYEPASELLKKIQAEKLAKEQEKKKKTTVKK